MKRSLRSKRRDDALKSTVFSIFPEKRRGIQTALLKWYRKHARDLPWRRTNNPYHIWLSEIMLQQTRVDTVVPYFERFLAAFPTVGDLARASHDRVYKLWEGLGYYSRARNMHAAAKMVVAEFGGEFPRTMAGWRQLPGVGPYTAGAIASIAFGERAAALDGNLKRVLARLFAIETAIDDAATTALLWSCAETLLPRSGAGEFNQALMDLGAGPCAPAKPRCLTCPLVRHCAAHSSGSQDRIPQRRAKAAIPTVFGACIAAIDRERILLAKRHGRGLLTGLWQLPMCDLEHEGQPPVELVALLRLSGSLVKRVGVVEHVFTHRRLRLSVYETRVRTATPRSTAEITYETAQVSSLASYAFSKLHQKVLALVLGGGERYSRGR